MHHREIECFLSTRVHESHFMIYFVAPRHFLGQGNMLQYVALNTQEKEE